MRGELGLTAKRDGVSFGSNGKDMELDSDVSWTKQ